MLKIDNLYDKLLELEVGEKLKYKDNEGYEIGIEKAKLLGDTYVVIGAYGADEAKCYNMDYITTLETEFKEDLKQFKLVL